MIDMDNNQNLKANFLIFLLCFIPSSVLSIVAMFFLFPNSNGIGSICISTSCGVPIAFALFFVLQEFRIKEMKVYLFSSLVFPFLSLMIIGYSLYQQRPENIFRVFVIDPIPNGVSNIRAHDISGGFETEIMVTFKATASSIEEIIKTNELKLDQETDTFEKNPNNYFEDLDWNQDWQRYLRWEKDDEIVIILWVNPNTFEAVYWFLAY